MLDEPTGSVVLDASALVWRVQGNPRLGPKSRAQIEAAATEDRAFVAATSAWKIATLVSKGGCLTYPPSVPNQPVGQFSQRLLSFVAFTMHTVDLLNDKCGHSKPGGRTLGCGYMLLDVIEERRR